ncbi:MAG TPA: MbtH family NRPS accessory protein [Candidatus Elarobacter sp.]|nr:MbtH family NRPS accessory protein [Candidatus Elarobacter sp.]
MTDRGVEQWVVLVNGDERYGLFPAVLPVPRGWRPAGFCGSEEACAAFVDERWTGAA